MERLNLRRKEMDALPTEKTSFSMYHVLYNQILETPIKIFK